NARPPVMKSRITLDEIHDAREAVEGVEVDRPLLESIAKIRRRLGAEGLSLSDRRYKESLSIVRSKAWLNGRTYAIEDDLAVLTNILWDDPANEPIVRGCVLVHDPFDQEAFEDVLPRAPGLRLLLESEPPETRDLAFDLFCSFYKYFVKLLPAEAVVPERRRHRDLLGRALELREHEKLRA